MALFWMNVKRRPENAFIGWNMWCRGPYYLVKFLTLKTANTLRVLFQKQISFYSVQFISVQSFSQVWRFVTPWTAAHQAYLSITNSGSLLKLRVYDAIQPSHSLLSPTPLTFNLPQHQGLLKWVSSSHQVAKVLEFQLQHQSFQCIFRTDFL